VKFKIILEKDNTSWRVQFQPKRRIKTYSGVLRVIISCSRIIGLAEIRFKQLSVWMLFETANAI